MNARNEMVSFFECRFLSRVEGKGWFSLATESESES